MASEHVLGWIGPDPVRVDAASVRFDGDRLSAHGTSTTAEWTVSYRLLTGPEWMTEQLEVHVAGADGDRHLLLRRDASGWSAHRHLRPRHGESSSETLQLPDLAGAVDCDLALCPLTNTMPVLRALFIDAAQAGEQRREQFVMAWISLPDLDVTRSEQTYAAGSPVVGGGATVMFTADDFVAHIEFDRHGLVVNYPSIARRITAT